MSDEPSKFERTTGGVLEPMGTDVFFTQYWEQQPLHIARKGTNPFTDLISIQSIEELLSTNELFFPTVQLSHSGHAIPISEYTDDNKKIVGSRIIDRYQRGSTIVLTHAHALHAALMNLCRHVQASFMMRCQTNVYLSPAGNQGFNPHFDTHDVFILQVSGKKTFNFYSGGARFPTSADRFDSDLHEVGAKTEEIELNAGDTLYIPRGSIHDAVAHKSEPSLHVTLGVYPVLMHELLNEIVNVGIEISDNMRQSVPQGVWITSEPTAVVTQKLKQLMIEQLNDVTVGEALSRLRDDVALSYTPTAQNSLSQIEKSAVDTASEFKVNHQHVLQLERIDDTVKLRCVGAVLEFNGALGLAVEWLLQHTVVRVQDLPGMDDTQRLALVSALLEKRVISIN